MSEDVLQEKMLEMCDKVIKAMGRNDSIGSAMADLQGTLKFINAKVPPVSSIYVVTCERLYEFEFPFHHSEELHHHHHGNDHHQNQHDLKDDHHHEQPEEDVQDYWHLTKGTRDDCVFLLHKMYGDNGFYDYVLEKEVCGVEKISNTLDNDS